jgi:hypothetical protein
MYLAYIRGALPAKKVTRMLSPHEISTLMLVQDRPDQVDVQRTEVDSLLAHQLIILERTGEGLPRLMISTQGQRLLNHFQYLSR